MTQDYTKYNPPFVLTKMCWQHSLRLFLDAYGSLADLTGRNYARWSRLTLAKAHNCPKCREKSARS